MAEVIPFITLGVSAVAATTNAVQTADAQGEAKKQADAATAAQDKLLAEQEQQTQSITDKQAADATRNSQEAALQQKEEQGFMTTTYDSGFNGPSVFGTSGFAAQSKAGSGAFGGL